MIVRKTLRERVHHLVFYKNLPQHKITGSVESRVLRRKLEVNENAVCACLAKLERDVELMNATSRLPQLEVAANQLELPVLSIK